MPLKNTKEKLITRHKKSLLLTAGCFDFLVTETNIPWRGARNQI